MGGLSLYTLPALKILWNGCVGHHLDKLHGIIAKHPDLEELMHKLTSITTRVNKSSQALDHARKCGQLVDAPWTSLKNMGKTRWWSFFSLLESFEMNKKTFRYQRDSPHSDLVDPEVYNLSDHDWADIEVLCQIVLAFKLAQETLEGELYITGSRVVAILEKIRADLVLAHLAWADSEKGARILASVESFETRFGDGSNVCEVDSEGPSRQPRGCTKVSQ